MKIDSELVLQMRREKSWSQEELAVASGLNLRTVQRIEREGAISLQSKKAIASAFNVDATVLDYEEPSVSKHYEYQTVVLKSDVNWLTGWGKKGTQRHFELDAKINEYGKAGWRVHTITHGSTVHGGAGQVMILFERKITTFG